MLENINRRGSKSRGSNSLVERMDRGTTSFVTVPEGILVVDIGAAGLCLEGEVGENHVLARCVVVVMRNARSG